MISTSNQNPNLTSWFKAPNALTCIELKQVNNFVHDDEFVTVILQSEHMTKQSIHPALRAKL